MSFGRYPHEELRAHSLRDSKAQNLHIVSLVLHNMRWKGVEQVRQSFDSNGRRR